MRELNIISIFLSILLFVSSFIDSNWLAYAGWGFCFIAEARLYYHKYKK